MMPHAHKALSKLFLLRLAIFLLALCIHPHLGLDGVLPDGELLLHDVSIAPSARIPVCPVLISYLPGTARFSTLCSMPACSSLALAAEQSSQLRRHKIGRSSHEGCYSNTPALSGSTGKS